MESGGVRVRHRDRRADEVRARRTDRRRSGKRKKSEGRKRHHSSREGGPRLLSQVPAPLCGLLLPSLGLSFLHL